MSAEDYFSNSLLHQQIQNERSLGIAKSRLIAAKTEGLGLEQVENIRLKAELDAARLALRESESLVLEWQAAMTAWKHLAQALRDEIKACPNHDAHKFGKDHSSRAEFFTRVENEERVKRGIPPRDPSSKN
jgi:hypothetical protein